MKKATHGYNKGYGIRVCLASLLAVMALLWGTSCTRNGKDPAETGANSMFESSAGTVADNNVGSVTSRETERATEKVTEILTEKVTSMVTESKSARAGK